MASSPLHPFIWQTCIDKTIYRVSGYTQSRIMSRSQSRQCSDKREIYNLISEQPTLNRFTIQFSVFYDTVVAKQLYRKLSLCYRFIYCRNLIYLMYGNIWLILYILWGVGIVSSQVFGHLRSFKGLIQTEACTHWISLSLSLSLSLSVAWQSAGQQSLRILVKYHGTKSTRLGGSRPVFGEVLISGKGA